MNMHSDAFLEIFGVFSVTYSRQKNMRSVILDCRIPSSAVSYICRHCQSWASYCNTKTWEPATPPPSVTCNIFCAISMVEWSHNSCAKAATSRSTTAPVERAYTARYCTIFSLCFTVTDTVIRHSTHDVYKVSVHRQSAELTIILRAEVSEHPPEVCLALSILMSLETSDRSSFVFL